MFITSCPDCGEKMTAEELIRHRPQGICLERFNRSVKGSPNTKVITGAELADRMERGNKPGVK